jgi:hypothetical protein
VAVGAAAFVAVAGPVLTVVGGIVSGVGALLPMFSGVAAVVSTALIPAFTALAGFVTATLIPAAIATAQVWGPIALAIAAVGVAIAATIKWWPEIKAFVGNLIAIHLEAAKFVTDSARKLYEGVKTWLLDKLSAVFKSVTDKVRAVGAPLHAL